MDVTIIRSNRRKKMELRITEQGEVQVRVPSRTKNDVIEAFVRSHEEWIREHQQKVLARRQETAPVKRLTNEEIHALADQALKVIPERVRYYAPLVGVTYGRITIRNQKSRWGSCSAKGNLNFNCLLMLAPPEVIDSVVVHELCHRLEMNHSARFYQHVYRVFPDYDRCHGWLKTHGTELMRRMTG